MNKKYEHHAQGNKFPFLRCSLIFDLTSDGQDTTIVKFTHELFPITRYSQTLIRSFKFNGMI